MKIKHYFFLSLLTGFALISACKKDEIKKITSNDQKNTITTQSDSDPSKRVYKDWREDFDTPNSLDLNWNLYGNPLPVWVPEAAGRTGLFENNGRLPDGSRAVSKTRIGNGNGYTIEAEVYIDVNNMQVKAVSPEIGVTRDLTLSSESRFVEPGISMKLAYIGSVVISKQEPDLRNQTFVQASALLQDGTVANFRNLVLRSNTIVRDNWHRMKIVVDASGKVTFFLDGNLVWSPPNLIEASLMRDKNVILGFVSGGSLGHAYHDWVQVTYPSHSDQSSVKVDKIAIK
jgi:hypothetical protein